MRTGCIHYSGAMMDHLQKYEPEIYVSTNAHGLYPTTSKIIRTFRGPISFVFSTLFAIPYLLFLLFQLKLKHKNLTILYPSFHAWNFIATVYSRLLGIKTIQVVHEYHYHLGEKRNILDSLKHMNIKMVDQLIFLSESELNIAKSYQKNIGIKSSILKHPLLNWKGILVKDFVVKPNKILFLGRISKYKGVEILLESISIVAKDFEVITIAGRSNYDIKIPDISNLNIIDRYLTEEEIASLINDHDILVLPYIEASQSGVIPLAIQAQMLMILSDVGGFKEQVPNDVCYFIKPNVNDLTAALIKSINDKKSRELIYSNLKKYRSEFEDKWKNECELFFSGVLN